MLFKPKISLLIIFLLACISSPCFSAYINDEIIVKTKTPLLSESVSSLNISSKQLSKYSTSVKKLYEMGINRIERGISDIALKQFGKKSVSDSGLSLVYKLKLPKGSSVEAFVEKIKSLSNIEFVQPNYIIKAHLVPNDEFYSLQWGLRKISAEAAWNAITGESSVIAAVIDTGVYYTHPDLSSGKVIAGYDFVNGDSDAIDDNGHGTHIAGIIGALTNNSIGVAGINWNCKIMPIKVLDSDGNGSSTDTASGIIFAANNGADVINMSFGDYADNPVIKSAVIHAYGQGSLLIASAGNEDTNTKIYPAAYDDYVIAVAATDQTDKRSYWGVDPYGNTLASNYGAWVDVSAPGTAIYSTFLYNTYQNKSGTSMACPFVVGLATMLLSINPSLTIPELTQRIKSSCDNIDALNPGYEGLLGSGRINVTRALGFPIARITSPADLSYVRGSVPIVGSATSSTIDNYKVIIATGYPGTLFKTFYTGTGEVEDGTLYTFDTTQKGDGLHTIKLTCSSQLGLTSETSNRIYIDNTPPLATISHPIEDQIIQGTISIKGSITDDNFSYYTLSYAKELSYINITTGTTIPANSVLGSWNTAGLLGRFNLRLTVYDKAQNFTYDTISVEIVSPESNSSGVSSLSKSTPNPFNPSKQSETYINYSLSENAPSTIYIFNMTGDLVYSRSFASGDEGGKAGSNLVPWTGKDFSGNLVGNGVFFYKISSTSDGTKKIVASGRIIVIR